MVDINIIKAMIRENGGAAKTSDFISLGMTCADVSRLYKNGILEKVKHGVYGYSQNEVLPDEKIIKNLFPDGILCMDTALFHYGYTDRTPLEWNIAFERTVSRSRLKIDYPNIKPYFVESRIKALGVTEAEINNGVALRIYDRERLICDCFRYKNKMDCEMFNKAVQMYIADENKNLMNLAKYSKELRVYKKINDVIGVWL